MAHDAWDREIELKRKVQKAQDRAEHLKGPGSAPAGDPVGDAGRKAKAEFLKTEAEQTDDPTRKAELLEAAARLRTTYDEREEQYREKRGK